MGQYQSFWSVASPLALGPEPPVWPRDRVDGTSTAKSDTANTVQIVPNSKLISNNFTNWSHNSEPARFNVDVGVAYSSDIKLVEEVLLNCVTKQKEILPSPEPTVQLINFGESSLDFKVFYFSMEFFLGRSCSQ